MSQCAYMDILRDIPIVIHGRIFFLPSKGLLCGVALIHVLHHPNTSFLQVILGSPVLLLYHISTGFPCISMGLGLWSEAYLASKGKNAVRDTWTLLDNGRPFDANPDANGQKTP